MSAKIFSRDKIRSSFVQFENKQICLWNSLCTKGSVTCKSVSKNISKKSFDSKENLYYSDDFDESGDASDIGEGEFDIDFFLCCKELIKNLRCNWWIRIYPTLHMTTRNSIENYLFIYLHFQTMFWNEYLFDIFLFWNLVSVVSRTS